MATVKKEEKSTAPAPTPTPTPTPAPSASGGFNPLSEEVDEKSYSGPAAQPGDTSLPDIPEPTYSTPPPEISSTPVAETGKAQAKKEPPPANPGLADASQPEKSESAEHMMQFAWSMLDKVYEGMNGLLKISDKKINKEERAGNIDTSIQVSYKGGVYTIREMFDDMNHQADGLLKVEPEFKEEMHPLLVAELSKAGHGMTPKQRIMFGFGAKIASDAFIAFRFLSARKEAFAFAKEMKILTAQGGGYAQQASTQQQAPAPAPENNGQQDGQQQQQQQSPDGQQEWNPVHEEDIADPNPQAGMTLQDAALAKFVPGGIADQRPNSVKKSSVKRETKQVKTKAAKKSANTAKAKKYIAEGKVVARVNSNDPVPQPKRTKGPGRPKGSRNKK